jgi:hypothetical protein
LAERRKDSLRRNISGIIGGILAFVSLALPWWTMSVSNSLATYGNLSFDVSVYPYMAGMSGLDVSGGLSLWYGWVALALIIIGGLISIVSSLQRGRAKILSIGGALVLFSILIFAVGLQIDFLNVPSTEGTPAFALFGSGSLSESGYNVSYTAYLSFGFWLALAAAIVLLIASRKKPAAAFGNSLPPPQAAQQ